MTSAYQAVAFPDVSGADADRCEARLLEHLFEREVLARTPIATLSSRHAPRMAGIMASIGEVADTALIEAAIARSQARKGFLAAPGARRFLVRPDAYDLWEPDADGHIVGDFESGGVEVLRRRVVRSSDRAAARCPECGAVHEVTWYVPPLRASVAAWEQGDAAPYACPSCETSPDLARWSFDPVAVCAELALRFGDWPELVESFFAELGASIGSRVVPVVIDTKVVELEQYARG